MTNLIIVLIFQVIKCFKKKISQLKYINEGRRSSLLTLGTSIGGLIRRGSRQISIYTRRTSVSRDRKTSEHVTENVTPTQREVAQSLLNTTEMKESQTIESLVSAGESQPLTSIGARRESIRSADSNRGRCNLPSISEA